MSSITEFDLIVLGGMVTSWGNQLEAASDRDKAVEVIRSMQESPALPWLIETAHAVNQSKEHNTTGIDYTQVLAQLAEHIDLNPFMERLRPNGLNIPGGAK